VLVFCSKNHPIALLLFSCFEYNPLVLLGIFLFIGHGIFIAMLYNMSVNLLPNCQSAKGSHKNNFTF